jgi:LPXTG-motif cell wall-anchored protein
VSSYRKDVLICVAIGALFGAAMGLTFLAHPAYGQDVERCTVQTFDPPIGPTWQMPGDADTVTVTLADGTVEVLAGPFRLGDVIVSSGPVRSIEKCTTVGEEPTPPGPTPTVVPTLTPEPTPVPSVTPTPEPSVTPEPIPSSTPIIPPPPTPPEPTPTPTPVSPPTATPTVPTLPATGTSATAPLALVGVALIVGGLILARKGPS